MNKIIIMLLCSIISINVCGQAKRTVRNSNRSTLTQKKATEKKKAEETAALQAVKEAEEAEAKARTYRNSLCEFGFDGRGFYSKQDAANDFVVYEIPEMSASDLKGSVFTVLSSMYKSPKDVITNLSDNMIQLEGYAKNVYIGLFGDRAPYVSLSFNIVIQFKNGKVRYNKPIIKQLVLDDYGRIKVIYVTQPISTLISSDADRRMVQKYFKNLIETINTKLTESNDW